MKLLHLSHRSNRTGILSKGLIRSRVKNHDHLEAFGSWGLNGVVYTWSPESGSSTTKYIKDMIYCKQFIHPRNDMFDRSYDKLLEGWRSGLIEDWDAEENWVDFSKIGPAIFGGDQEYDLYEIEVNSAPDAAHFIHIQDQTQTKFGTTHLMDDDYAHDDKPIFIFDRDIRPAEFNLVAEVSSRIFNNKIHITERTV